MEENQQLEELTPTFTSARNKMNKYKYFIFVDISGNGQEIDCDILIHHHYESGKLFLTFENNEYVVHNEWRTIDYGYNNPQ